jgi:DNA-binding NtrC family response regulator
LQPYHIERPEAVKELTGRSGTEWIAVLNQEVLRLQNVDFVCEWFFDFHTLPFDVSRCRSPWAAPLAWRACGGKGYAPVNEPEHELLGDSRLDPRVAQTIVEAGFTESPVLIRGDSGTGKELVAKTLHRQSQRHAKPFVAINQAIPEHLIQSELFGHEKGAFTGAHQRKVGRIEAANGGTLFLDEIGDLPMELQANLLRFLQEKQIERVGGSQPIPADVRVLGDPRRLEAAVAKGAFREDLYYRLNVLQVVTALARTPW